MDINIILAFIAGIAAGIAVVVLITAALKLFRRENSYDASIKAYDPASHDTAHWKKMVSGSAAAGDMGGKAVGSSRALAEKIAEADQKIEEMSAELEKTRDELRFIRGDYPAQALAGSSGIDALEDSDLDMEEMLDSLDSLDCLDLEEIEEFADLPKFSDSFGDDVIESGISDIEIPSSEPLPTRSESRRAAPQLTPPDDKEVQAKFFSPETYEPGETFLAQLGFAFAKDADTLEAKATQADPDAVVRGTEEAIPAPEIGTKISFAITCENADIDEPIITKTWRGRPLLAQFGITPHDGAGTLVLDAAIFVEGAEVGSLKWRVKPEGGTVQSSTPVFRPTSYVPDTSGSQNTVFTISGKSVFVSYSSKDTEEVVRRVQAIRALGISVFVDFLSIEAGEVWEDVLESRIASADRFLLFWSERSATSKGVEKEWRHALECQEHHFLKLPKIIPVMISKDAPTPPPPLAHIHFERALAIYYQNADT